MVARQLSCALLLACLTWCAQAQQGGAHHVHPQPRAALGSSAALSPDGRLWLVGLDGQGRLFVQDAPVSLPVRWGAPQFLDTFGDTIAADGENRPKLAFGPGGQVVISYTQPLSKPYTGRVRLLRSVDGGHQFAAPVTVHADRQEVTHRFDAIAFDGQGVLHTVWIDKRDLERAPKIGRKSSYRGAAIYRNESRDGGATFGPDIKLADHSCECCRIAIAQARDGTLRAMWRHVFEPNVRDHAFAPLHQGAQIVRASEDDWRIDACPHHGPGLVAAEDGGYHTVWFGVRNEGGQETAAVRYARLDADGRPRRETVRAVPDEFAEHADVGAAGARVAIVWRSVEGAASRLRAWVSSDGGGRFKLVELSKTEGANDQPRLLQQGARMLVVWRTAQEVQVHEIEF